VDKLLEQALVRKIPSPLDGRAFHLSVTPKGMKAMRDCWAVYRNGIRDFFGEAAEEDDVAAVLKNLEKWGQL
jgi:DNA-binding MarR family transcriptional regulator